MRRLALVLLPALLPLVAMAETSAPAATASETTLPAITVSTIAAQHLRDTVIATGLISAEQQIQVAPLIEGQPIEALLADVGDKVAAGQVLARLSTSSLTLQKAQFTASLASARAQIAQAEAQVTDATSSAAESQRVAERARTLQKQGTTSQAALDQANAAAISAGSRVAVATQTAEAARAQLALVEAQLANLELQLSRTEVTAPFAGEITARSAQLGAIASASGQPMFTLIRDGALELRADVSETDLARLAPGQPVQITLVGQSQPDSGKIRLVEPVIDTATRLGRVRIDFDDSSVVRAGMYAEATILLREAEVIAVPITAFGTGPQGGFVMRVVDGQAHLTPVQTGTRDHGWIEITQGLAAGDLVVTKAGAFVRDGDHINPIAAAADATN
jgi:HlyD family secretion protein